MEIDHGKSKQGDRRLRRNDRADEVMMVVLIAVGAVLSRVVSKAISGRHPTLADIIVDPWRIAVGWGVGMVIYSFRYGIPGRGGAKPKGVIVWIGRALMALFLGAGARGMAGDG